MVAGGAHRAVFLAIGIAERAGGSRGNSRRAVGARASVRYERAKLLFGRARELIAVGTGRARFLSIVVTKCVAGSGDRSWGTVGARARIDCTCNYAILTHDVGRQVCMYDIMCRNNHSPTQVVVVPSAAVPLRW